MGTSTNRTTLISFMAIVVVLLASATHPSSGRVSNSCKSMIIDKDPHKSVCVCTETQCDRLDLVWPESAGSSISLVSDERGSRFRQRDLTADEQLRKGFDLCNTIKIDLSKKFQPILGWGGSFTDSAGINIKSLSEPVANQLLDAYFGSSGLQYNYGRVPIAGTDFSVRNYTYDDTEVADPHLEHWSLADEDFHYKIPYILQAKRLVESRNDEFKLIASPWTAPAWMKTNNKLVRGRLTPTEEMYSTYTDYLMKFYDAYHDQGIDFWGATVQNEPFAANLPVYFFNSMQFNAQQMSRLIRDHLGPALEARGMTKDKFKLIIGDDSLGFINKFVPQLLRDPSVNRYVSGLAFHWYTSGSLYSYDKLLDIYNPYKEKLEFMLMTEACTGSSPLERGPRLGVWKRAEQYADDIIQDLTRFTNGWIDWNLALDEKGGPNWSGNYVDAPIIVDAARNQFYKQPMYYALAHFTRLFRPGSIRVQTDTCNDLKKSKISSVAVVNNETGHLIVNILNRGKTSQVVDIQIEGSDVTKADDGHKLKIKGHSLNSFILKL